MNEYLPIGTVVTLQGAESKPLMITGYLMYAEDNLQDYCAVPFPLGFDKDSRVITFNSDAINDIVHMGFKDKDFEMLQRTNEMLREKASHIAESAAPLE